MLGVDHMSALELWLEDDSAVSLKGRWTWHWLGGETRNRYCYLYRICTAKQYCSKNGETEMLENIWEKGLWFGFWKTRPRDLNSWVLNAEEAWQLVSLLQCQVRAWWRADQPQQCQTFSTYTVVETALGILDLFTCHFWVCMCHVYNTRVNVDGGAHAKARGWRSKVRV